jgi:hypothetical protein
MKKFFVTVAACALAISIGSTALAQCRKGYDCDNCIQGGRQIQADIGSVVAGETDPYLRFKQNTLDLRQEMMNKRFELQRENLNATPDTAKVAGLKAEIRSIQARINVIRLQSDLPETGKRDGECFKKDGGCYKQDGLGGCNGQPCGQK